MAQRYISKPHIKEAVQWDGTNLAELVEFSNDLFEYDAVDDIAWIYDELHSTHIKVFLGQWIAKGLKGEFYPVDREVFDKTYSLYEGT